MRLICPGCGAQYEVDDGIIPDAGRDVQCSACGQVWFQKSRPMLLSEEEAVALPLTVQERRPAEAPPSFPVAVDQGMSSAFAEDPDPELPGPSDSLAPTKPQPRRALDESLLAILREEAEREARARRAETPVIETQEEMNLIPADVKPVPPEPEAPAPEVFVAETVVPEPVAPEPVSAKPVAPPRPEPEPIPDINALKASLRASADRNAQAAAMAEQGRGGFRLGFVSVLAVAALATAIYGFAPKLAEAVPDLNPALSAYVDQVNHGRFWLDEHLRSAMVVVETAFGN